MVTGYLFLVFGGAVIGYRLNLFALIVAALAVVLFTLWAILANGDILMRFSLGLAALFALQGGYFAALVLRSCCEEISRSFEA